jgi:two-component system NtrC family sensor kinase
MTSSSSMRSPELDPEQSREDIHVFAHAAGILITIGVLINLWGQWSTFLQVLLASAVIGVANVAVDGWFTRHNTRPVAESVRVLVNAMGFMVNGHLTGWMHLLWFYVPFNLLWYSAADRWVRVRLGTFLVVVTSFALWDGADPNVALTFVLVGIFSYLLTEKRMNLMRSLLQEVIDHREQLHVAYQRAMEQEKLSSLGVMAAGVAHEINNPMSFVTSNISSLYRELKGHSSLPESFREYVDDVLPATLDGIRRVNAIVGDLRRFARGDAEVYVEYDLNTEVQAALRIAHNQLSHCHVETELGEVGSLTGRPRQIVQALVNVLVNAGQATASGGRVHLSTRREGEWVRVEVRDTGTGIPPEVMRNLFQPFFTTKPQGTGMGLGLAVSHGIITAHGGRIEVDTTAGKGSCFTFHLPRVPRQPDAPDPLPPNRAKDAEDPKI